MVSSCTLERCQIHKSDKQQVLEQGQFSCFFHLLSIDGASDVQGTGAEVNTRASRVACVSRISSAYCRSQAAVSLFLLRELHAGDGMRTDAGSQRDAGGVNQRYSLQRPPQEENHNVVTSTGEAIDIIDA